MHTNRNAPTYLACRIVGSPCADDRPGLRLLAWAVLKSERGQSLRQSRLRSLDVTSKARAA